VSQGKLNGSATTSTSSPAAGDLSSGGAAKDLGLLGSNYNQMTGIGQFGNSVGSVGQTGTRPVAPQATPAVGPVPLGNGPVQPNDDQLVNPGQQQ